MALLQQDMDDPACLEAYGEACLDLGQVDDALKIYLRLVTQKSEDKGIRRLLARALMAEGGLDELRTHLPHVRGSAAALAFLATIVKDHSGSSPARCHVAHHHSCLSRSLRRHRTTRGSDHIIRGSDLSQAWARRSLCSSRVPSSCLRALRTHSTWRIHSRYAFSTPRRSGRCASTAVRRDSAEIPPRLRRDQRARPASASPPSSIGANPTKKVGGVTCAAFADAMPSDDILASTCHVPAGGGVGGGACGGVSGATLSVRADAGCAIEGGTPGVVPAGAYGADELDLLALYFAAVKVISMITMRLSYDYLPRMASTPPSIYGRCSS